MNGGVSRQQKESPVNKINDVTCRQSLLGRLFGYETWWSRGHEDLGVRITMVQNPTALQEAIDDGRGAKERLTHGIYREKKGKAIRTGGRGREA